MDCNAMVNPGAFDVPGNALDDDCDGQVDNAPSCDQGLASNSPAAMDFAKAIELCQATTLSAKRWGVVSAALTLADGTGTASAIGHSIRHGFGTGLSPEAGVSLVELSTGAAAARGETNPAYPGDGQYSTDHAQSSPPPADLLASHGGKLPATPGCPDPDPTLAHDPEMLDLSIRVPVNAKSFSFAASFYSYEYPEWVCSSFNDLFAVLLDSGWAGVPANPTDKNLAVFRDAQSALHPVSVNLAYGSTGLFQQCVNGTLGCAATPAGTTSTCVSTSELIGTGFDIPAALSCNSNSLAGGATGWLKIAGNVVGGEVMRLRVAIWDTGDSTYDSTVALDNFRWSTAAVNPGAATP